MTSDRGPALLTLARNAIARRLGELETPLQAEPWWQAMGSTFVTLTLQGHLRGCVGSLTARLPLAEDVALNAQAAAFSDARFPPLTRSEFPAIRLEVSLLSPPEPVRFDSREHLLTLLRPGVDGVVLEGASGKGTFLPQVWEQLADPAVFLGRLMRKAGLSEASWSPELRVSRYTVTKWQEEGVLEGQR